jgi:hypothetical protein
MQVVAVGAAVLGIALEAAVVLAAAALAAAPAW